MADTPTQLLDLNTLIERPRVRIDGTSYEILSPDELSILQSEGLARDAGRLERLARTDPPTVEAEAELLALVIDLSDRIMVGVPAAVRKRLSEQQRLQIIEVFVLPRLHARMATAMQALGAMTGGPNGSRSIGVNGYPGSPASSAAGPAGGSRKPRSPSSGPIS